MMDSRTLYKLIILYMINKVNFPLTNAQIVDFFLEKEYTDYFRVQEVLSELDSTGFVFCEEIRNSTYYHITNDGEQALEYFSSKIPNRIVDDIDMYLLSNKYELRNEVGTLSDYFRTSAGEYIVHCQVKEGKSTLIELNLSVPTKEEASCMCSKWKDASQTIYAEVMKRLMTSGEQDTKAAAAPEMETRYDDLTGRA